MLSLKDKTLAVVEWAREWDGFGGYLKLNALITEDGDSTLVTDTVDNVVTQYIGGEAIRQFSFTLRMVLPWSDGHDNTNENSMAYAVKLYDWLVERENAHEYPDWENAEITELVMRQSLPQVNFIYEEDSLAEYLIQCMINYEE